MYKKGLILLVVAILTLSLAACGKSDSDQSSNHKGKLEIRTTVYPLKSFVQQIGGKHVDVKSVYPNGGDPHTYDPSQKQMVDIGKSDLFLYTGDNLDPVAKKIAKAINDKDKTLSLESSLDKKDLLKGEGDKHEHEYGEEHEHHHHGKYDPHIWLDSVISQKFAKAIKDELVKKDSKHQSYYEGNYKKLVKELKGLDKDMKQAVKGNEGETVYISHDSIGYLADRYNFKQEGIENMNAEEPSQKDLTNIVKQIKEDKVKNILAEENVSNKIADTVRKETNAKIIKFYNMGPHTKQQDNDKNTYQSFMKENIKAIEKALENE
ncbi:zinc ABC transporter substrate-binding protein [Staphylococcus saccharolyticus]|uniref:metal ABC transporter solute-binding protein, Zn/Mn family n=1 Tax=Staphylococcus saccharolyticus TaxID=33028 RepID=UPI00102DF0B9|nr:zinc ABC transporter substrate-binding protein [Staphylococcus saccharolyticus]MBL7573924.1 zinc ABC transporter substrate-binding protein [Staphylococcus saccharolyticus]MBL7584926.1 zinc ABC transporter substrate-binding protein [Staphylococcus saccharolyticus]MBL7639152.1 zinc ABC transporter substrate-binding protein [Staphylococcus saccharolyticus]QRJ68480.1 zinc ABC transporter substrate-binding protein [Staphylococcus saccharolyticus]TAA91796.1 ABC transporter substrate-binding prote